MTEAVAEEERPRTLFRPCAMCGLPFIPKRASVRYCSSCSVFTANYHGARGEPGSWTQCPLCGRPTSTESGFCKSCERKSRYRLQGGI